MGTPFIMLVKFGFLHYGQIQPPSMGFWLIYETGLTSFSKSKMAAMAEILCGDSFYHVCQVWFSSLWSNSASINVLRAEIAVFENWFDQC